MHLLTEQELNKAQADLKTNSASRDTIKTQLASTNAELASIGADETRLHQLERARSVLEDQYRSVGKILDERRVVDAVNSHRRASVRVIEAPIVPTTATGDTPPCAHGRHARGVHSRIAERPPAKFPVGRICAPGSTGTGYRAHGAGQPSGVRRARETGAAGKAGKAHNAVVISDGRASPTCDLRCLSRWPACDRRHLSHGRQLYDRMGTA